MYLDYINLSLVYLSKFVRPLQKVCKVRPVVANVKITERCNCRCITCNMWKNKGEDELTVDEFTKIFEELKRIGVKTLILTGGEPLLREEVDILINEANNLGFKKIILQTNGILLHSRAKRLIEAGITDINTSIDGSEQTHDMMRGITGAYKRAVRGLYTIREESVEVDLNIVTTLTKLNIKDIPSILELCKKLNASWGVNLLDYRPYFFRDIDIKSLWIDSENDLDKLIDYIKKYNVEIDSIVLEYIRQYYLGKKIDNFNCILGYLYIYLDAKGNVYPGCWVLKPVGNIRNKSIKEILNSKTYKKRVEMMFSGKCPGCTCGYGTNVKFNKFFNLLMDRLKIRTSI